jgi:hypothetical protein
MNNNFEALAGDRWPNAQIHGRGRFALRSERGEVYLYQTEAQARASAPFHNSRVFDLQTGRLLFHLRFGRRGRAPQASQSTAMNNRWRRLPTLSLPDDCGDIQWEFEAPNLVTRVGARASGLHKHGGTHLSLEDAPCISLERPAKS